MTRYIDIINSASISANDARHLLCGALGCDMNQLHMYLEREIDADIQCQFDVYVARRTMGEPVDNILASRGFWMGEFTVNEHVLSPRPDIPKLYWIAELVADV